MIVFRYINFRLTLVNSRNKGKLSKKSLQVGGGLLRAPGFRRTQYALPMGAPWVSGIGRLVTLAWSQGSSPQGIPALQS